MKRGQKRKSQRERERERERKQELKLSLKPMLSMKKKEKEKELDPPVSVSGVPPDLASSDVPPILSQDFFCTPDYITPECQNLFITNLDPNKDCPASPHKFNFNTFNQDTIFLNDHHIQELSKQTSYIHDYQLQNHTTTTTTTTPSYVPHSAIALRSRVMPPPCLKNPYIKDALEMDVDPDPFRTWRTKCSGYLSTSTGANNMSRYRADFQEIELIGNGNFSRVYKVLKRVDGCMYAVKRSTRQLCQDTERRKALMEVQAMAALGFHENIVGYHNSWFENEQLYIQMELCDSSLSIHNSSGSLTENEVLQAFFQIARALQYIHDKGIAHLDVKPENIYMKNAVYKLGDFGCATLLDKSLPIEEGDARYMPQEILNDKYDHLNKVDIYSLGVSVYELLRGSSLPDVWHQHLREGKLPLLPSNSLQLQNLLKVMVDPDPTKRPSAEDLIQNSIFSRIL